MSWASRRSGSCSDRGREPERGSRSFHCRSAAAKAAVEVQRVGSAAIDWIGERELVTGG